GGRDGGGRWVDERGDGAAARARDPRIPPRRGPWSREATDAFPLAPRAAGARTARRRRAAGCRPPKIGPSEQKSRRPRLLIANAYLPGVTVGGICVRCSAPPPACGKARSRCQPLSGRARPLVRRRV